MKSFKKSPKDAFRCAERDSRFGNFRKGRERHNSHSNKKSSFLFSEGMRWEDRNEESSWISEEDNEEEDKSSTNYCEEIKHLHKEQLKAYICKLRKELKMYKIKEMNFKMEIKYLRRKIFRLKNVIDNDKIIRYEKGTSIISRSCGGSSSCSSYHKKCYYSKESSIHKEKMKSHLYSQSNISNRINKVNYLSHSSDKQNRYIITPENGGLRRNSLIYRTASLRSEQAELKSRKHSIQSITESIQHLKRKENNSFQNMSGRNYAQSNYSNNTRKIFHRGIVEKNSIYYSDYSQKDNQERGYNNINNNNNNSNCFRSNPNQHEMFSNILNRKQTTYSNRSVSSFSRYELKKHLISNDRNIRNLSNEINNKIATNIKNFYHSKDNILKCANDKKKTNIRQIHNSSELILNNKHRHFSSRISSTQLSNRERTLYTEHSSNSDQEEQTPTNNVLVRNRSLSVTCNSITKKNRPITDLFHEKHHQRILSKTYISPYAFKQTKPNQGSNKKSSIIPMKKNNGNQGYNNMNTSNKTNNTDTNKNNNNKKNKNSNEETEAKYTTSVRKKNETKKDSFLFSSSPSRKTIQDVTNSENEESGYIPKEKYNNQLAKNVIQNRTSEKSKKHKNGNRTYPEENDKYHSDDDAANIKNEQEDTEKHINNDSTIKSSKNYTDVPKLKTDLACSNLKYNLKKNNDMENKDNLKKELEELKKRSIKLIKKPPDLKKIYLSSNSSNSSVLSNTNCDKKKNSDAQSKAKLKDILKDPLKNSNHLNISFNDIDKRISSLQQYLKKTKR